MWCMCACLGMSLSYLCIRVGVSGVCVGGMSLFDLCVYIDGLSVLCVYVCADESLYAGN